MSPSEEPRPVRYVALGDSYTIGTAVEPADAWPSQLAARVTTAGALQLVANLGVNGYTSGDVIRDELPRLSSLKPDVVSLLVGVNDVVQGVSESIYRANVARILDDLLTTLAPNRIWTVATPDYTVTPAGADYGEPAARAAGILEVNAILRGLAGERRIAWVDIHDLSLRAGGDRTLVAVDGLHPSGRQYSLWVDRIAPVVAELLAQPPSR
ncbi:MAG TPA: SGNH/GDSL hydrolase family protein [Candidatus Limnocylindrales bacterium]